MDTPLEKLVGQSGPDHQKAPVEAYDEVHGKYHNPVCDVKQPFSPSADRKHSFVIKEGK
jgi:hypothetical protein